MNIKVGTRGSKLAIAQAEYHLMMELWSFYYENR